MGRTAMTLPPGVAIEAVVRLLRPDEGGRKSGIFSGYRCNCWIGAMVNGERAYNDATFYLVEEPLNPGAEGIAWVRPHFPEFWSHVGPDAQFDLCEGARIIGKAVVLRLL
jgi:translation elongation factor EF-Tu-like GTPase